MTQTSETKQNPEPPTQCLLIDSAVSPCLCYFTHRAGHGSGLVGMCKGSWDLCGVLWASRSPPPPLTQELLCMFLSQSRCCQGFCPIEFPFPFPPLGVEQLGGDNGL